ELVYGVIDRTIGASGLRLFDGLLGMVFGAGLFVLAIRCCKDLARAVAITVAAFAASLNVWSERPLFLALVGMLAVVAIVELPDSRVGRHPLVAIPVLMALWTNVHGTFVIGFGYLALHFVGRALDRGYGARERALLKAGAIAAVVTLVNPYGLDLVL